MNPRCFLPPALVIASILCSGIVMYAQRSAGAPAQSAKAEALAASGTIRNEQGEEMVARAIYVKVRKGFSSGDAPQAALSLASRVGLHTASATQIPFTSLPARSMAARIRGMSQEKAGRVEAALEDMSRIIELHYTSELTPQQAARLMMRNQEIEYAEPVVIPSLLGSGAALPNDPLIDQEWQLQQTKALEAWEIWTGDTNMVIGIVDAGIDNTHEDLAPNIRENAGETGIDANGMDKRTNFIDDDGDGLVDNWKGANLTAAEDNGSGGDTRGSSHGTQVAGLAAATANNGIGVAGIANRCRFFPIKAAPRNSGFLIRGYEGIVYAAEHGCKVINVSWGGSSYSQAIQNLISDLVDAYDVAIVAAGGNNVMYAPEYPAGYRHVLGVGAVDPEDQYATAWGEQIDIASPAGYTTSDGNQYFGLGPATSYASPVAAGALALVRSKYPTLTADQAIAHLRLTADNIDAVQKAAVDSSQPLKSKLLGYGRLNLLRALTTDPFSHPAIVIDSVWLTAEDGTPRDGFRVGERGLIRFRMKNLLGSAADIHADIALYTRDSSRVAINSDSIWLASLPSGTSSVPGGIPFEVKERSDTRIKIRFDISSNNGAYSDYAYEQVLIYRPYTVASTSRITLSLTDRGRIGYEDYPSDMVGTGVSYQNKSFLYEGGLIIASDSAHLLSNVRGANPDIQQRDFTTIETPSAANDSTLLLDDGNVENGRRIGLQLRMRPVTVDSIADAVGIQLRVKNTSGAKIDSLRVAMFCDWDLADNDQDQTVTYVAEPGGPVPYYGRITYIGGYSLAHGVAAPAELPIFYAIRNDAAPINIYESFDQYKKWITVSNGVGDQSEGPIDISMVIGKRIVDLAPNAEDTTLFTIGISTTSARAIQAMKDLVGKPATSSVADEGGIAGRTLLGQAQQIPFTHLTRFTVRASRANSTLRIFDAYGRQVADLTAQLPARDMESTVTFDASALASGVYHIRLVSGPELATRQIVLVR
jgi:hypothetical protein